jgi:hypothetical protein
MAGPTITPIRGAQGKVTVNTYTATYPGPDTIPYASGQGQLLELTNTTAGSITATLTGSTSTTISPAGIGGTINVATGYAIVVPATTGRLIVNLDTISAYLSGVVSITSSAVGLNYALYQ